MKKKLMSNIPLKIISLVAAFLFWLLVVNFTDPKISKTFENIPVEIMNEDVITSANQVYYVVGGDTVNVTISGKRSFVESLTEKDFEATADLGDLSVVNATNVNVRLKKTYDTKYKIDTKNAVLKVKLEERVTKKYKVEIETEGNLSEGYVLGEMKAKPNIVEVSCAKSKASSIDHVGVTVIIDAQNKDFDYECEPVVYSLTGEQIEDENITFNTEKIKVSTQVLETKEIPVEVETEGKPASGYRLVSVDHKPDIIRVSGTESELKKADKVVVPIHIQGAKKDIQKEIDLQQYVSRGLTIQEDSNMMSVRCTIEKNGTRRFSITANDVEVKNLPIDCAMEFVDSSFSEPIVVYGKSEFIDKLEVTDLGAYVDLLGMSPGTHMIDIKYTLPLSTKVKKKIKVKVLIKDASGDKGSIVDDSEPTDEPGE